jgi:hypothetical protein
MLSAVVFSAQLLSFCDTLKKQLTRFEKDFSWIKNSFVCENLCIVQSVKELLMPKAAAIKPT